MAETTDRIVKQVKHMKRDEEMLALIANRMPLQQNHSSSTTVVIWQLSNIYRRQ
jgi:hypothetical protein